MRQEEEADILRTNAVFCCTERIMFCVWVYFLDHDAEKGNLKKVQ